MKTITLTNQDNINQILQDNGNDDLHLILSEGTYFQKVKITGRNVLIESTINAQVVIDHDDFNYKFHPDGLLFNTFRTATLTITGSNVTLKNITIKNSAGKGRFIGQALAVAVYGNQNSFYNCELIGHQDTLFIGPLPLELIDRYAHILPIDERTNLVGKHYFKDCKISGDVDFIFGSGNALFDSCEIVMTDKGYVTAPSHYDKDQLGFIFNNCTIKNASEHPMVLGRPWRDFGRITFINCTFEGLIGPRYNDWNKHTFFFLEYPYVKDALSQPISDENLAYLKNQISKWRL